MPPTRKLIAYTLATYANSDGTRVRPGTAELVEVTGLSDRCVQGHVRALRSDGWILQTYQGSRAGRAARADEYRLTLPEPDPDHRNGGSGDPGTEHRNGGSGVPPDEHRNGGSGDLNGDHRNGGSGVPGRRALAAAEITGTGVPVI